MIDLQSHMIKKTNSNDRITARASEVDPAEVTGNIVNFNKINLINYRYQNLEKLNGQGISKEYTQWWIYKGE